MRRLIRGFAGRTYHIVGNLMHWLIFEIASGSLSVSIFEPRYENSNKVVCATSKGSDQPAQTRSLIRAIASRLN